MSAWISLHYTWLLGLAGIVAAILLINWQLAPGPAPGRESNARVDSPGAAGLSTRAYRKPTGLGSSTHNRAARRRAASKNKKATS